MCVTASWAAQLPVWVMSVPAIRAAAAANGRFSPMAAELVRGGNTPLDARFGYYNEGGDSGLVWTKEGLCSRRANQALKLGNLCLHPRSGQRKST